MLKNNIEIDTKVKMMEVGTTQLAIAADIGTTAQYINRVMKKNVIVNKTFVKIMESLGYDVVLTYVKRG